MTYTKLTQIIIRLSQNWRNYKIGILLAQTFRGQFYNYEDPNALILKRFDGETIGEYFGQYLRT